MEKDKRCVDRESAFTQGRVIMTELASSSSLLEVNTSSSLLEVNTSSSLLEVNASSSLLEVNASSSLLEVLPYDISPRSPL